MNPPNQDKPTNQESAPSREDPFGPFDLDGPEEPLQRFAVRDKDGRLRGTQIRSSSKRIWWLGGNGRTGLQGERLADLPLYGTERLARVPLDALLVVTEGPKDCQAVWRAGVAAVGTMTGAGGVPSLSALEVLHDRLVVLWPDNDPAGRTHMERIVDALRGVAREVRWVDGGLLAPKAGAADVPASAIASLVLRARVIRACVGSGSTVGGR